jgi:molybdate transport system permease protein
MRLLLLAAVLVVSVAARAAEVTVFAAASLTDALDEVARGYGEPVVFNFGASSTLARQIRAGAPADVFLSADERSMDAVRPANRVSLLSNTLLIVGVRAPDDLLRVKTIALADPSSVPAGIYAKDYLTHIGLWDRIAAKVVPCDNVRAALAAFESGNADAAIVYRTDTKRAGYQVPRDEGPAISYPAAALTPRGERFVRYLQSAQAQAVFRRYGFLAQTGASAKKSGDWRRRSPDIIPLTLEAAALSTILIVVPGLAVAWLLARKRWRGKTLVETFVALPLVMPPVATGLLLLEFGGWLKRTFGIGFVFTWRAVVVAMMVMSFPLLVRAARVAFEDVNPRFEQIARSLGAGDARVFVTITLPLAARGIVSGMLLAFARGVGEFGATILVAGNIPGRTQTLSLAIYNLVQLGHDREAFRLLLVAVIIAFVAVWIAETFLRRAEGKP